MNASAAEVSVLGTLSLLLRNRVLVALTMLVTVVAVILPALLRPRTYSAVATVMPQAPNLPTGLTGLASTFGLALPTTDVTQSPAFYADLLRSRLFLARIVDTRFVADDVPHTIADMYEIAGEDSLLRRERAIRKLQELVATNPLAKTGVVELRVTLQHPEVARQVADSLLSFLTEFNTSQRQSQAAAEARFALSRLQEEQRVLREAEREVQSFLERNRNYQSSAALQLQFDRLNRNVNRHMQMVSVLTEALDRATIDRVRDTPVLTIVEPPERPVVPNPRRLARSGVLALIAGVGLGLLLASLREALRGRRLRSELVHDDVSATPVAPPGSARPSPSARDQPSAVHSRGAAP